jgi:hypothetical protein
MAFEWDEEQTEEALDELIEQVEEEAGETEAEYDPSPGSEVVEAPASDEVTEPSYDPPPEAVADSPSDEVTEPTYDPTPEPEVVAASASVEAVEEAPMVLERPMAKKKTLSMLGIAFAVLAVVSVIGLFVVLNYDTWIDGAEENNIGDTQMMYVYLAVVAVIVCILVVVFDFVRNRKAV